MSVRQSLGKVAVVPKGSWDGTKTYEFLDIVKYGGGSYIARKDVPIGTAITNTEYWVSLVDKGEIGDDGVSPSVTVTPITGGHRVTITDKAHPHGQSFDVMDGEVEGAVRFDETQTLTDSQKAQARTNVGAGTYSKPSGGIPKTDLASSVQTTLGQVATNTSGIGDLKSALKSGDEEDAIYHLGFYLDENGDLCQVEEETNNG